jgi:hypothetical protein
LRFPQDPDRLHDGVCLVVDDDVVLAVNNLGLD